MQHFLYFFPLPQGQGSFRFGVLMEQKMIVDKLIKVIADEAGH
jgi:hypothetical protein